MTADEILAAQRLALRELNVAAVDVCRFADEIRHDVVQIAAAVSAAQFVAEPSANRWAALTEAIARRDERVRTCTMLRITPAAIEMASKGEYR